MQSLYRRRPYGRTAGHQVADRFRLLQNLAEALDQVFSAHGNALKAVSDARSRAPVVQPDGRSAVPVPPSAPTPQAQTRAQQRRPRRLATYEQVWRLHHQGWSNRTMAQPLGHWAHDRRAVSAGLDIPRAQRAQRYREERPHPRIKQAAQAMERRVSGGLTALSEPSTPWVHGELPHGGALCPASAPGAGVAAA